MRCMTPRDRSQFRIWLCVGLLTVACLLTYMLHSSGWNGTLGSLQWLAALFAAFLPILLLVAILGRNGLRFGLKSLLAATLLSAVFLAAFLLPYTSAKRSRETTQSLKMNGIGLHAESTAGEYYATLGVHGGPQLSNVETQTRFWIEPLLVDLPEMHAEEIHEVDLWSDEQIAVAMLEIDNLPNLQMIRVFGLKEGLKFTAATATGLVSLSRGLRPIDALAIIDVAIPEHCCQSFSGIRHLSVVAHDVISPVYNLTDSQLHDISSTPGLEILYISGCSLDDEGSGHSC